MFQRVTAALLILVCAGFALDATTAAGATAAVPPGQFAEHIDAMYDRQGNLIGGDIDAVGVDSIYWKPYAVNNMYASAKAQSPVAAARTAMTWLSSVNTSVCMDPAGDYVYETYSTNLRRFKTSDGTYANYALSYTGGDGCATDGQYIYRPRANSSTTIDKYTMTGTYVNSTTTNYACDALSMSCCRDTVWFTNDRYNGVNIYGYACSKFTGGSISNDVTWNVGTGTNGIGKLAYDGTYWYLAWIGATNITFKRFYANRTLYTTGTVNLDTRGVMCVVPPRHDVGVSKVIAPTGIVDSGAIVTPACSVYNYGNQTETYKVRLVVSGGYVDSATVTAHAKGMAQYVTFTNWTAAARGTFAVTCSTRLTGDADNSNDKKADSVKVNVHDVAAVEITVPATDTIAAGAVIPAAKVQNSGTLREACKVFLSINTSPAYLDSVTLAGGLPLTGDTTLTFAGWNAVAGTYTLRCSVSLGGDQKPANNVVTEDVVVKAGGPPPGAGWVSKSAMPLTPGGKEMKDGAWLAYAAGDDRIFAAKGNKQGDFYSYDPATDAWTTLLSLPLGIEAKGPSKGAVGVSDGEGKIYATKGNNTQGFWLYDAGANTWTQKKDVPLGLSNKKVKGGTDLAYVDGKVYLLKGYKDEFWKYDPAGDSWSQLANAPTGVNAKWDKGSWLATDGDNKIYAHKAKYHEFYAYDADAGTWSAALTPMPLAGITGSKKAKDGSAGVWDDTDIVHIWALKGGNTTQFFRYDVAANTWAEKETMPQIATGTTKKKKVKGGGDLVAIGSVMFAIKGNKAQNIWQYSTGAYVPQPQPGREGVMAEQTRVTKPSLTVSPNPLATGSATVSYSLPKAGTATVTIHDALGRTVLVRTTTSRAGSIILPRLSAGVYLVKLASDGFSTSQKLVVQH